MKLSLALPCMFTETLKTFSTLRNKKQTNKQTGLQPTDSYPGSNT